MKRGVFVLLDGARNEYPIATHWVLRDGVLEVRRKILGNSFQVLAAFGRFDQVGYLS